VYLLVKNIGFLAIDAVAEPILLKKLQFPREKLAEIKLYLIPIDIFTSVLASKLSSMKKEFTIFLVLFPFKFANNFFSNWILNSYKTD
jgi:hypothetical protein